MTHPSRLLNPLAIATIVAVTALAACQDRKPTEGKIPSSSSAEYPAPSEAAKPSTSNPVDVPGQGTDVTAKSTQSGMVGGATGTVGSGGKPGSGSASGAGTGAAESSDTKVEPKK